VNKEKKTIAVIALVIAGLYFLIISIDFGPIPRSVVKKVEKTPKKHLVDKLAQIKPEVKDEGKSSQSRVETNASQSERSDSEVYGEPRKHLLAARQGARWVVAGDVLVDESQLVDGAGDADFRIANIDRVTLWESAEIPIVIEVDKRKNRVQKALKTFERFTSIRFVAYNGQPDYIAFVSSDEVICQSYLGRKGGMQEIILHPSCSPGQVIHEVMHALGFVHEHSRADRDSHIIIHWDNILTNKKNQFQALSAEIANPGDQDFDMYSVLLYPPFAFSKNNQATITTLDGQVYQANRSYLSKGDIAKVESIYGEASPSIP
jgi:hypothetical protein